MEKLLDFPYAVDVKEAKEIQEKLKSLLSFDFPYEDKDIDLVAGIDVSYNTEKEASAAVVVLDFPSLRVREVSWGKALPPFPYIPGFLSFREGPAIEKALSLLCSHPQIFFFDGQGIAHPRGVGLATHLGILFGMVSVGVAKSNLVGNFEEPPEKQGSFSWIEYQGEKVGMALRTKEKVKPVFVSPGNRIDLEKAKHWTLLVTTKYRLPEPVRQAHIFSEKIKKGGEEYGRYSFS